MATVSTLLQGLAAQIAPAVLLTPVNTYLIPDDGNAIVHVNAADLHNGTAKIGPIWTENGTTPYNLTDTPIGSVGPFTIANYFSLPAGNILNFPSAEVWTGCIIFRPPAGSYGTLFTSDSTTATGINIFYRNDALTVQANWNNSAGSLEGIGTISNPTVGVVFFGRDSTGRTWLQLNGNSASGFTPTTLTVASTVAQLGLDASQANGGNIFEVLFSTDAPSGAAFTSLYNSITANIAALSTPVIVGIGWPSKNTLDDLFLNSYTLVSIYDGDGTRNTTRWGRTPAALDTQPATPGVSAALSTTVLTAGKTATLTLTGTPNVGDAAVLSAQSTLGPAVLGSATTTLSETLAQLATALAASIQSGAYAAANLTASAVGGVITLTNASGGPAYQLLANTGNVGSRLWENRRVERHVRVIVWTNSEAAREAVGDPLDVLFAQLSNYFGFALPTGEWVRLKYMSDTYVEDAQLADVYRRDFRISLEYGVNQTDLLYPILGTSLTLTP